MIDTIKIYARVSDEAFKKIEASTDTTAKFNLGKEEIYYKISKGTVKGSYDSNLNCRPRESMYGRKNVIELEGSYHKLVRGYNSHNGFYDIKEVVNGFGMNIKNLYSDIYRISNKQTLGITEKAIARNLKVITDKIIEQEKEARKFLAKDIIEIEDTIMNIFKRIYLVGKFRIKN